MLASPEGLQEPVQSYPAETLYSETCAGVKEEHALQIGSSGNTRVSRSPRRVLKYNRNNPRRDLWHVLVVEHAPTPYTGKYADDGIENENNSARQTLPELLWQTLQL